VGPNEADVAGATSEDDQHTPVAHDVVGLVSGTTPLPAIASSSGPRRKFVTHLRFKLSGRRREV